MGCQSRDATRRSYDCPLCGRYPWSMSKQPKRFIEIKEMHRTVEPHLLRSPTGQGENGLNREMTVLPGLIF